jgi:hypothetical protein
LVCTGNDIKMALGEDARQRAYVPAIPIVSLGAVLS